MASHAVMAGLVPAIHVFSSQHIKKDVDARDKRGHDGSEYVAASCRQYRGRLTMALHRHGRTCSGHPRLFSGATKDVDARDKRGHDGKFR